MHDPARNRHRQASGGAWSKVAVRAILQNPRYSGREVWNQRRRDEVLVDVEDVALGHESKMRWNPTSPWVWSEHQTHPAIIDSNAFEAAQDIFASAQRKRSARNAHAIRRSSQAWSAARSAAGRCKGRGTTARRTTDASSRPSTPSPRANTASATPSLLATGSCSNRTPTSRSPQPGSPRSNVTAEFSSGSLAANRRPQAHRGRDQGTRAPAQGHRRRPGRRRSRRQTRELRRAGGESGPWNQQ
jgi:recombinase